MRLLIAIPAYNEESSIAGVIQRSLDARNSILANSPVSEIEITVVSDGSTDGTVALASPYQDRIKLIAFEHNRGYGAAIKTAWNESDADVLGFMDADGTCDPKFFSKLCLALETEGADVVIGSRLTAGSRMPLMRRLGNVIFALTLTVVSSKRVHDTASGMRVVRRSSLPKLLPLPDGLHFTPAMSARAILSGELKISEVDMPYYERSGESKLRVAGDGLRFLKVILEAAFLYRPSRPLVLLGLFCTAAAIGLMVTPTLFYLENRSVAEWMIYRFVVSTLAGTTACLLFSTSYLTTRIIDMTLPSRAEGRRSYRILAAFFSSRFFWFVPLSLMLLGTGLVLPSILERVATGSTYEHWSRYIAMSFLYSIAVILIVERLLDYCLERIAERLAYIKSLRL